MSFYLKIKAWKLFLLFFGVEFISLFLIGIFNNYPWFRLILSPLKMCYYITLFFGWMYSLGVNLHKKLPPGEEMNVRLFKILLIGPIISTAFVAGTVYYLYFYLQGKEKHTELIIAAVFINFIAFFCYAYCAYFIAKALKIVELQRMVWFADYSGEVLFMLNPVYGVWSIQPRINRIFSDSDKDFSGFGEDNNFSLLTMW